MAHSPSPKSERKFFYGWVILGICSLGKVMSFPGQSPVIGQIVNDVRQSLELSRSHLSALYLVATVCSSITLPFVGKLLDRVGPRVMIGIVSMVLAVACLLTASAHGSPVLLVGLYLLRLAGQGSMVLVSQTVINYWFIKRRGLAMGVGGAIMSLGTVGIGPVAVGSLADAIGWRRAYLGLSLLCVALAPLFVLLFRAQPERMGVLPDTGAPIPSDHPVSSTTHVTTADASPVNRSETEAVESAERTWLVGGGEGASEGKIDDSSLVSESDDEVVLDLTSVTPKVTVTREEKASYFGDAGSEEVRPEEVELEAEAEAEAETAAVEDVWTHKEALRTAAFWCYSFASLSIALTATALYFHLATVMEEKNIDIAIEDSVYFVAAVVSACSNIGGGLLIDRLSNKLVMSVSLIFQAIAMLCVAGMSPSLAYVFAVSLGISMGLASNLMGVVNANLFGRAHLGAIAGTSKMLLVLGSAIGPLPFALGRDLTGSFSAAFAVGALIPLCMMLLVLCLGNKPSRSYAHLEDGGALGELSPGATADGVEKGLELTKLSRGALVSPQSAVSSQAVESD